MEEKKQDLPMCENDKCSNLSKFECPTCKKLELAPSYFCSQDCFKGQWSKHKAKHIKCVPVDFPGFKFTGPLRPWTQSPRLSVPKEIVRPDYADHPEGIPESEQLYANQKSIYVNSQEEIEGIKAACKLARKVLDTAHSIIAPGITTNQIDEIVHKTTIQGNAYPSPLNYYLFPKSVCTSVNEIICHGIPDGRKLVEGDIVNVDVTVYLNGFHGDTSETYLVGEVAESSKELIKTTYEAMFLGIEICRPGVQYKEIGKVIEKEAKSKGYSVVRSYTGHGVGRLFHSMPNVPHYGGNSTKGTMREGHVFTIEPMINQGKMKDTIWPDQWTVATIDGQRTSQFEHTILITHDSYQILTARNKHSPVLNALLH